ncbi:hypothetical protein B9P90_04265 [Citrobacter freundii]|uniref:Uncharacterized protein n=1 Tax=Citrobacter freundii TaxID=546 RepID=A0AA44NPX2_CITFR|nr:hypothetical protein [Citrobacter freundii]OYQ99811.1 hypothetical protein B9P90_04265 [Citrobacter freundii]OYR06447.1 hypothetical protein B9P89_05055 [Citrobacter freundii]
MFDEKHALGVLASLTDEELNSFNDRAATESQNQFNAFEKSYENELCYLCGKSFKTISKDDPCLHWLLRRCKFKTKDLPLIYSKYGYTNIAAFLRWCANMEKPMVNINDMAMDMPEGKIISNTIKWKNIEWTFDCSESDFKGHAGTAADFPHYHFQMRIDGQQFINFNSFHLPFSKEDIFALTMSRQHPDKFHHDFGKYGMGMDAAMDLVSEEPEEAFEHMERTDDEGEAIYNMSTLLIANEGKTISGDLIADLIEESNKTGVPLSKLIHQVFSDTASVKTVVSPSDNVPEIAKRTEHKKR